jgi:hypothetical protein
LHFTGDSFKHPDYGLHILDSLLFSGSSFSRFSVSFSPRICLLTVAMKIFLVHFALAASSLVNAIPHGPDEEPMAASAPKQIPKIVPSTNVTVPVAVPKISTTTPAGCYRLATDTEWPSPAEWIAALPRVIPRASNLARGVVRPDYHLGVKNIAEVQAAVKFCAKNKIRLTIINSGHDFLGAYTL